MDITLRMQMGLSDIANKHYSVKKVMSHHLDIHEHPLLLLLLLVSVLLLFGSVGEMRR